METHDKKRRLPLIAAIVAYAASIALIIFETVANSALYDGQPPTAFTLALSASERIMLAAAFACVAALAGYGRLLKPRIKGGVIAFTASVAVAVANFPFFTLIGGELTYTANAGVTALYLVNCVAIGAFEECAFRGVLLPFLFGYMKEKRYAGVLSAVLSSAIFALFHIFNLFAGASFGGTLMQVGYTFLTGCMFAALLLLTRSVLPGIVAHALYDVGGTIVTYDVAEGSNWDAPSIAIMAVVSALAGLYLFIAAVRRTAFARYELLEPERAETQS